MSADARPDREQRSEDDIRADIVAMDTAETWIEHHDAMLRVLRDVEPLMDRALGAEARVAELTATAALDAERIHVLSTELSAANAAVERVQVLHHERKGVCWSCPQWDWPCPTALALSGDTEGEQR